MLIINTVEAVFQYSLNLNPKFMELVLVMRNWQHLECFQLKNKYLGENVRQKHCPIEYLIRLFQKLLISRLTEKMESLGNCF